MKEQKIRRIRPAFITSCLHLGGSTTFLLNLARGLMQTDIDFRIVSLEAENPMQSDFRPFAKKMLLLDQHSKIFEDRVAQTLQFLSQFRPSHVVACLGPSSLEILRYVPLSVPRLALIQSNDPGPYRSLRAYIRNLDGIGAVSLEILSKLKKIGILQKKHLGDVRYGVEVPNPRKRQIKKLGKRPLKILYCGRIIQEQKRIYFLPKILETMDSLNVDYRLSLAGDGPDLGRITKILEPWTHLEKVFILGKINQVEVGQIMDSHDIFLLFSDYEGLPLSLLEALAHGLVPVISDLGRDFREIIKGTGGKLVDPKKPQDYAKAISKLSKNRLKIPQYRRLCYKKWKAEYSSEEMTKRWTTFLAKVPSNRPDQVKWDEAQRILPPLPLQNKIIFRPAFRPFRRLLKSLKK